MSLGFVAEMSKKKNKTKSEWHKFTNQNKKKHFFKEESLFLFCLQLKQPEKSPPDIYRDFSTFGVSKRKKI